MSLTTPPTIVANVLAPAPTKNLATNIPANESVTAQPNSAITNTTPEQMKTGRRPLISDIGARTIGEMAKPMAQVVTPVLKAKFDRCHFCRRGPAAMEYEPAL